jgi:hypothetical protein
LRLQRPEHGHHLELLHRLLFVDLAAAAALAAAVAALGQIQAFQERQAMLVELVEPLLL